MLASNADSHQRSRTGRLHIHARPAQVQFVRDARREIILVVREHDLVTANEIEDVGSGAEIIEQIGVHAHPGINTDQPFVSLARVSALLQRFPSAFEEKPVLRIHNLGFLGIDPEKLAVEPVRILQHRTGLDVIWIIRNANPCLAQFLIVKERNGFDPVPQVFPERLDVPRFRKAP